MKKKMAGFLTKKIRFFLLHKKQFLALDFYDNQLYKSNRRERATEGIVLKK